MAVNPFYTTGLLLYPLKTSEIPQVCWCFQGVEKEISSINWVNACTNRLILEIKEQSP